MLSVIIDASSAQQELPALLMALTPAAVDGLVRDVMIAAPATTEMIAAVCEETGAEVVHGGYGAAAGKVRSERVLVLPAALRLRAGWIGVVKDHLARGGRDAVLIGQGEDGLKGLLRPAPFGVLTERTRLDGLAHAQLQDLRRRLPGPVARLR